jgi:hypothetical protein
MTCTASLVTNGNATKAGLAGLGNQLRAILIAGDEEQRPA